MSNAVENTLQHFGILGMKWGVRRFQNPDGTLTPEGKRRYGRDFDKDTDNSSTTNYQKVSLKKAEMKEAKNIYKQAKINYQKELKKKNENYNEQQRKIDKILNGEKVVNKYMNTYKNMSLAKARAATYTTMAVSTAFLITFLKNRGPEKINDLISKF